MKYPIPRILESKLLGHLGTNKVVLLFGTRRVGKTFLLESITGKLSERPLVLNGEDFDVQEQLRKRSATAYRAIIGNARLLIIDEAQAIPEVGNVLKLMIDTNRDLTILATGSSSLDLSGSTGDPLTGRHIPYLLFPISEQELDQDPITAAQKLDERLVYGSYPETFRFTQNEEKARYLQHLVQSYLLKDILTYSGIRHSDKIHSLLRLVAFQTGSEVSYQELSNQLGISKITVESYLDLLSKVYILFKIPAYSTNQRSEVTRAAKWYFYDNGVRNAVVGDFRIPTMRNDVGALWESYLISERIKKLRYADSMTQFFFWRDYHQQEIDLIEYENGQLRGFEIKFSPGKKYNIPGPFRNAYPDTTVEVITRENYLNFIT